MGIVAFIFHPDSLPLSVLGLTGAVFVGLFVVIVLHELGHAVVGLLFGFRLRQISIGGGTSIVDFDVGPVKFRLGWRLFDGGSVVSDTSHRMLYRTRKVVELLAGSLTPIALASWLWVAVDGAASLRIFSGLLLGISFLMAAISLWPAPTVLGPNDGLLIARVLKADRRRVDLLIERAALRPALEDIDDMQGAGDVDGCARAIDELVSAYPTWPGAHLMRARSAMLADDLDEAMEHAQQALRLAHGEGDKMMIDRSKMLIAFLIAIYEPLGDIGRAEEYARSAQGHFTDHGVLGAVLARAGEHEEAELLLAEALVHTHRPAGRHTHHGFLAISAMSKHDVRRATASVTDMRGQGVESDRLECEVQISLGAAVAVVLLRDGLDSHVLEPEQTWYGDTKRAHAHLATARWAVRGWLGMGTDDRAMWRAFTEQGGDLAMASPEAVGRLLEWSGELGASQSLS